MPTGPLTLFIGRPYSDWRKTAQATRTGMRVACAAGAESFSMPRACRHHSPSGVDVHPLESRTLLSGTGRVKHHHHRPATPPPQVPQALTAEATSTRSVTVSFTDPARDATSFTLQRSVNGSRFQTLATLGLPHRYRPAVYVDNGVSPDVTYAYRVLATNAVGSSGYCDPATAVTPDLHNLLFFGNSFTLYNDLPALVAEIAADDGHATPNVVTQATFGWTLADHLDRIAADGSGNVIDASLPAGQGWDDVVIQDFSTRATSVTAAPVNGDPRGFLADVKALFAEVRANSPDADAVLTETWARGPLSPFYPGSYKGPSAMQADVRAQYVNAATVLNALYPSAHADPTAEVAPAGEGWRGANWARDLYDGPDEYHPSPKGSALAALIVYRTLYHEDVTDVSPAAAANVTGQLGLSPADWTALTTIADAAVA